MKQALIYSLKVWLTTSVLTYLLIPYMAPVCFSLMPWQYLSDKVFASETFARYDFHSLHTLILYTYKEGLAVVLTFSGALWCLRQGKTEIYSKLFLSVIMTSIIALAIGYYVCRFVTERFSDNLKLAYVATIAFLLPMLLSFLVGAWIFKFK